MAGSVHYFHIGVVDDEEKLHHPNEQSTLSTKKTLSNVSTCIVNFDSQTKEERRKFFFCSQHVTIQMNQER